MGIGRGAVIGLILKYIGGKPLLPALRISAEGTPPLKQIGFGSITGLSGLTSLTGALNGTALSSLTNGVFQNPIGSITGSTLTSITSIQGNLTTNLTGLVDPGQLTNLTTLYGQIGSATGNIQSLSNNISGISLPDFDTNGSAFGLSEVTGVVESYATIKTNISSDLNLQFGNVTALIDVNVANVIAPLDFNSRLTQIKANIEAIEANLIAEAGGAGFNDYYANAVIQLQAYRDEIITKHDNSVNSMTKLNNGLEISNSIGQTGNAYKNGSTTTKSVLDKVITAPALANIKLDLNIT